MNHVLGQVRQERPVAPGWTPFWWESNVLWGHVNSPNDWNALLEDRRKSGLSRSVALDARVRWNTDAADDTPVAYLLATRGVLLKFGPGEAGPFTLREFTTAMNMVMV